MGCAWLSLPLNIVATCGRERARDLGRVENSGDARTSMVVTDFLGVKEFVREFEDFRADFFTEPVKFSRDFRGSVADDDDRLRSLVIH